MNEIKTFLLVGAGGTGSVLAEALLTWLVATFGDDGFLLGIVDGDHVEEGNLARQLFRPHMLEMPKATALARKLDHRAVIGKVAWLDDENVTELIQDGDTVIIAADNYAVRKRIAQRAKDLDNVRVINAGNEEGHGTLQDWIRSGGIDLLPPIDAFHPEITSGAGVDPSALSCTELAALPGGGQTLAANFMSAAWVMATLADPTNSTSHEIHWDLDGKTKAYQPAEFGWKAG